MKRARLFHAALALVFLVAWLSLLAQVDVLIGSRGLLPAEPLLLLIDERNLSFHEAPTFLRWTGASDGTLHAGIWVGIGASLLAFAGVFPRWCAALNTFLYLGYTIAAREFFSFQWDNLLLEAGLLAVFVNPENSGPGRHGQWVWAVLRLLLFKLYFESGIAKYGSHLKDWHDGSAMTFYYETAPLPGLFAWHAHHLPTGWHHFESWATLVWELGAPLLIIFPRSLALVVRWVDRGANERVHAGLLRLSRRADVVAIVVFTCFQLINIATANYGFFCYLSLALSVGLLDEEQLRALSGWLRKRSVRVRGALARRTRLARLPWAGLRLTSRWLSALRAWTGRLSLERWQSQLRWPRAALAVAFVSIYVLVSYQGAVRRFSDPGAELGVVDDLSQALRPYRVINTYALFTSITRYRLEVELQTFDGAEWRAHDLHYKPGKVTRRPPLVAPHQPRVDFRLWFYPLGRMVSRDQKRIYGVPGYVRTLMDRLCHDPRAVQSLFPEPLPPQPKAVKLVLWDTRFTSPEERDRTGAWWHREAFAETRALRCH